MAGVKNAEWIVVTLVLALAIVLTTSSVQALAVSPPNMKDLNSKGKPWIPAQVGENTEFQITIWGEDNATVEIIVNIENENALGFASFDPENFRLAPGESKQVRCIFAPRRTGIFKSLVVISESSPANVLVNPIHKSIAFDVEVHAELPPTSIDLTKATILLISVSVIVAVTSMAFLKLKSKRRVHRVLTHLYRAMIKVTSTTPLVELVPKSNSAVDDTKDNDNILAWERIPVRI